MMRRVLIAGAGVGGLAAAHALSRSLATDDEIVVFDRESSHTFWPSLLWLMTGTRRPDQVRRSLGGLKDKRLQLVYEPIRRIDPQSRTITAGDREWAGDAIILSLGADLDPGLVPGLAAEPGNFYTIAGAEAVWNRLREVEQGHVVVLISRVPFKCPAAPYEAAMLIDGFLRKRRRRDRVEVSVWAAEPTPMGVAGPRVSQAVVDALSERRISYHPDRTVSAVDPESKTLHFPDGSTVHYDLLAYVPPHRVPQVAVDAGLAAPDGWVKVDPKSMETAYPNVFAIGDMTGIPLAMGKPLPKAGVFAHRQGEAVAKTVRHRIAGGGGPEEFDGHGECFIEMGGGVAGFARGNFYAEPTPDVTVYRPGRHWHAAKVAFERHWWGQWW
jgi:sulfide:quinone oxidoreductase